LNYRYIYLAAQNKPQPGVGDIFSYVCSARLPQPEVRMSEEEKTKLTLDSLKQPKVLIAAAVAALGGIVYAGDGFTVEFSTCATEEAPTLEIIELGPAPEEAAEAEEAAEE